MQRIRITAVPKPNPAEELHRLEQVRRDLYVYSPVEVDPDNPAHATHRDQEHRAYFEFSTDFLDEARRILRDYGHEGEVTMEPVAGPAGEPCVRCGHIAGGITPPVCPNCGFREIAPCPHCREEVGRQGYEPVCGDLFQCPRCRSYVRVRFNDPLLRADGSYSQPVLLVEEADQAPV